MRGWTALEIACASSLLLVVSSLAEETPSLETLREELAKIQKENAAMTSSSRWRMLVAGGAIVLLGIAIGAFAPRSRPDKTRRLRF